MSPQRSPWHQPTPALAGLILLTVGCSPGGETNRLGRKPLAIAEGTAASEATAVFHLEVSGQTDERCTATLVTPHLLLTAAHCLTGQVGDIDCESAPLGDAVSPSALRLTNAANLQEDSGAVTFYSVQRVHHPHRGETLCGRDVALIEVDEAIEADQALPLPLRIAWPDGEADPFMDHVVIGYGAGFSAGTGEGVRRQSSVARIACSAPSDCDDGALTGIAGALNAATPPEPGAKILAEGEVLSTARSCPGDSGAPLIARTGRGDVFGIVSRGVEDCSFTIASLPTAAIAAVVRETAERRGDALPDWAREPASEEEGPSTPTAPTDAAVGGAGGSAGSTESVGDGVSSSDGGCAFAATRPHPWNGTWLGLLGLAAFALARMTDRRLRRARQLQRTHRLQGTQRLQEPQQGRGNVVRAQHVGLLLLCFLGLGCSRELTDTEGRVYQLSCKKRPCQLAIDSDDQEPAPAKVVRADGRLLLACDVDEPGYSCRPLTCAPSSPCAEPGGGHICENELCQNPQREITPQDRLALCLAGTGEWQRSPEQLERLMLTRACQPPTCTVPPVCRKP